MGREITCFINVTKRRHYAGEERAWQLLYAFRNFGVKVRRDIVTICFNVYILD